MLAAHLWIRRTDHLFLSRCFTFLGCALLVSAAFGFDAWKTGVLPRYVAALLLLAADVGFFLILMGALRSGWPNRVLTSWPLQILGLMCYSIYVWHGLVLKTLFPTFETDAASTFEFYPIYLFYILGISAMTYRFIEFRHIKDWRSLFLLNDKVTTASR
jgi:peptidoglycan/LPS O-acetylase OafA/YrhL